MSDTDRAARLMIATAEDLRVHGSLEDEHIEEEEAGAERMTGTDRGLAESPEAGLAPTPSQPLHEKTSTRHQPPITQKKKCIRLTPRPAPDPARHPDPAPIRAPGQDPGLDANQEVAKTKDLPQFSHMSAGPLDGLFFLFDMNVTSIEPSGESLFRSAAPF